MTVIKHGTIIDGTGGKSFTGDVIVEHDKIVDVTAGGSITDCENTIDATGCLVTPGFIDAHTHSDAYLIVEPNAPSKITQGITTEINGQCGGSIAPRYGEARLSSDWAAVLGEKLTWRSLAEYREVFNAAQPAVNTVQFIGHNTLRSSVVGYAGRAATPDELRKMVGLLEAALDEGGYGLSTGLIYQPGKYATKEEVETLAKITAERGGYYSTHMRSEGDDILAAIDEVIALVKKTGIKAEISHLKTSGKKNWHKIDEVLSKMDNAVNLGLLMGSDRYPYCAAGTDLDVVFPDWAGEGGTLKEIERLKDGAQRKQIVKEINALDRDWSTVMIGGTWHEDNKSYSGKYVSELGDNPGEIICSIIEKDLGKTGAFFFGMSEDNLNKIYARDWVVPGSDASLRAPWGPLGNDYPHPRAYATMPEFYRRVRGLGFSREATIARMTSKIARRFGIRARGEICKGNFADIIIWEENNFKAQASYLNPHQFTTGIKAVMVNGEVGYQNGVFTNKRAGRFLER